MDITDDLRTVVRRMEMYSQVPYTGSTDDGFQMLAYLIAEDTAPIVVDTPVQMPPVPPAPVRPSRVLSQSVVLTGPPLPALPPLSVTRTTRTLVPPTVPPYSPVEPPPSIQFRPPLSVATSAPPTVPAFAPATMTTAAVALEEDMKRFRAHFVNNPAAADQCLAAVHDVLGPNRLSPSGLHVPAAAPIPLLPSASSKTLAAIPSIDGNTIGVVTVDNGVVPVRPPIAGVPAGVPVVTGSVSDMALVDQRLLDAANQGRSIGPDQAAADLAAADPNLLYVATEQGIVPVPKPPGSGAESGGAASSFVSAVQEDLGAAWSRFRRFISGTPEPPPPTSGASSLSASLPTTTSAFETGRVATPMMYSQPPPARRRASNYHRY